MNIKPVYKLAKYLKYHKQDLAVVVLSLLSIALSLLLIGRILRRLVDNGLVINYQQSVNHSVLLLCVLITILSIGSFFRSYLINRTAEKIINRIRVEAYNNLINHEITVFEELQIGDVISRLTNDMELISKFIVNILSFFIRNSLMMLGGMTLMFLESPKLSAIVIVAIPLILIPLGRFGNYVKQLTQKTLRSQGDLITNINETFTNVRAIYAFNQQVNKIADFQKQISLYLGYSATRLKIRALFFAVSIGTILMSIALVIWIGSMDIIAANMSTGTMVSFIYYAVIVGFSSGGIFEVLSEIHLPIVALERVFALAKPAPQKHHVIKSDILLNEIISSLEFKNVSFSYPSRPNIKVIDDISFKILSGKFTAIVGRSGSGKSTLMQLLLKFYQQQSGIIAIDDQNTDIIDSNIIRQSIAYVPQEANLFSGTIRSNIIFAKPNATEEEINKIVQITGIDKFVEKLPHNIDTKIGEKGIRLSGGQKQRISLARALLCQPQILLLDEAMSALDSESEQQLLTTVRKIMHDKMLISIAHRVSSIENADNILVIDKGKLVAEGKHIGLLSTSKVYRIICNEQFIEH